MRKTIKLVITDLDNTLYDWIGFYVPSFLAMISELSLLSGIDEESLKNSFKRLHQQYQTTEYTFAIQQLDVLKEQTRGMTHKEILSRYKPAINLFKQLREKHLKLYPTVEETLRALKNDGKKIAAVTDSFQFHCGYRIKQLGIEDKFDALVSPPDHGFPVGTDISDVRSKENGDRYFSRIPIKLTVAPGVRKPDKGLLLPLLDKMQVEPSEAILIGDSLLRDISLAQTCGVHDVHASYGNKYDQAYYSEIFKITCWAENKIDSESQNHLSKLTPSYTANKFGDILKIIHGIES